MNIEWTPLYLEEWTPLYLAVRRNDSDTVRQLCEEDANVHELCECKTPLQAAAANGNCTIIQTLLDHKADPNTYEYSHPPLYNAAKKGHFAAVQLLLKADATAGLQPGKGISALGISVEKCQAAVVQVLLDHGLDPNDDHYGDISLLKLAFENLCKYTVKLLVKHEAAFDGIPHVTGSMTTFMAQENMISAMNKLFDCIKKNQKALESGEWKVDWEVKGEIFASDHYNVFHSAAEEGHQEMFELLQKNLGLEADQLLWQLNSRDKMPLVLLAEHKG